MDPTLGWDKSFVSPSSKRKTKSTLEDRATFWKATSTKNAEVAKESSNTMSTKMTPSGSVPTSTVKATSSSRQVKSKKSNATKVQTSDISSSNNNDDRQAMQSAVKSRTNSKAPKVNKSNTTAKLQTQTTSKNNEDRQNTISKYLTKKNKAVGENGYDGANIKCKTIDRGGRGAPRNNTDVIVLDSDDDKEYDED